MKSHETLIKAPFPTCFYAFKEPADLNPHGRCGPRFRMPCSDVSVAPVRWTGPFCHPAKQGVKRTVKLRKKAGRLYHGLMVYNHIVDGI